MYTRWYFIGGIFPIIYIRDAKYRIYSDLTRELSPLFTFILKTSSKNRKGAEKCKLTLVKIRLFNQTGFNGN